MKRLRAWAMGMTAGAVALSAGSARADQVIPFDGTVEKAGLDHVFIDFDVPAGTKEIAIAHDDLSSTDILDWGLDGPNGFRGWGGGNAEDAVASELAASRSYLAGPITPGKWRIVIGKAKITGASVNYHIVVTLRTAPTLPPQPERKAYAPGAPLARDARWYAGDLHAHSIESGDARPPIEELVTYARSRGLDFVELSDHNTVSQLDFIDAVQQGHADILILPGVEYTTYAGHANGIGATAWVDHKIGQPGVDIASAARQFHAQKALFSINHPVYDLGNLCIGCAWKYDLPADAIDGAEIATAGTNALFGPATLAFWDSLCDGGRHIAAVGGSDDHSAGQNEGTFSTPLGTPATYVFASDLSVASILQGIRDGRTVVKIGGVADPMVELTSDAPLDRDNVRGQSATLHAKITGGAGLTARWVKNGKPQDPVDVTADPFDMTLAVTAPAHGQERYRVEVLRDGAPTTVTSHVWTGEPPDAGAPPAASDAGPTAGDAGAVNGGAASAGGGCALAPGASSGSWLAMIIAVFVAARAAGRLRRK